MMIVLHQSLSTLCFFSMPETAEMIYIVLILFTFPLDGSGIPNSQRRDRVAVCFRLVLGPKVLFTMNHFSPVVHGFCNG